MESSWVVWGAWVLDSLRPKSLLSSRGSSSASFLNVCNSHLWISGFCAPMGSRLRQGNRKWWKGKIMNQWSWDFWRGPIRRDSCCSNPRHLRHSQWLQWFGLYQSHWCVTHTFWEEVTRNPFCSLTDLCLWTCRYPLIISRYYLPDVQFKCSISHVKVKMKITQSCPTLCNPMEFSSPEYWKV